MKWHPTFHGWERAGILQALASSYSARISRETLVEDWGRDRLEEWALGIAWMVAEGGCDEFEEDAVALVKFLEGKIRELKDAPG